jgi:hypothetical protein
MIEDGLYFCANPACLLHVRAGDPGVHGRGNWALIDGGIMVCEAARRACSAASSRPMDQCGESDRFFVYR